MNLQWREGQEGVRRSEARREKERKRIREREDEERETA